MAINRIKVSRAAEKLAGQNRFDAAIAEYQKLLDDSPADLATLNKVGDLHRRTGQTQRALTCFRKIAEHYRDHGFAQKAIAMFKKIAKLDQGNPDALEQLVALYSEQGLVREALKHLRQAAQLAAEAGESERALELEYRALELCPDDATAQRAVAARLRDAGEIERCIAAYLKAASGFAAGQALDEAVGCCREALGVAPLDPVPAEALCRLLLAAGEGKRAVKEIETLLEADPETPHLLVLQGEALLSIGEPARAREVLERARGTAAAEGNVDFHVAQVRIDLAEGQGSVAVDALQTVVPLLTESQRHDVARRLLCDVLRVEVGNPVALRLLLDLCRDEAHSDDGHGAWALLREQLPGSDLESELSSVAQRVEVSSSGQASTPLTDDQTVAIPTVPGVDPAVMPAEESADLAPVASPDVIDDAAIDQEFVAEHLTEADVFIKYKLLPKAVAHLKRIVERYPYLVVAHQRLVAVYNEMGESREVVYHSAVLVHAHHQRGATTEARAALVEALRHAPRDAYLQEMRTALRQGRPLAPFVQAQLRQPTAAAAPPTNTVTVAPAETVVQPEVAREPQPDSDENVVLTAPTPEWPDGNADAGLDDEIIDLLDEAAGGADVQDPGGTTGPGEPLLPPGVPAATGDTENAVLPEGGFFDLAGALEDDLACEGEELSAPVTEDGRESEEPASGIRRAIQEQVGDEDHQTHYQLGIAFKEMGLLDEAIGEFQQASRDPDHFASCCSMLGLCFQEKTMPKIADKWYRRGLEHLQAEPSSDQYLGLLYDLAELHLACGESEKARDGFTEVFATNANYREVASRIKQMGERLAGADTAGPVPR